MIEDADIDQCKRFREPPSNQLICVARLGYRAWVVVAEDHRRGIQLKRSLYHFPRMNTGSIDGAIEEIFRCNQSMAIVEEETGEDFSLLSREVELKILARLGRRL